MDRRSFIRNGSLTGASLAAAGLVSAADAQQHPASDFSFNEATITGLQQQMQSGKLTALALVKAYQKRIREIDQDGPGINAIIEMNPDAESIARQLDAERKAGKLRGALHGIPVLIKDNIDSGDKMMTTAGSVSLVGHRAARDAFIVSRLREAGAVLLGKTNLSEWANFRSSDSTSGWSSRGLQTRNPYVTNRNPSGSSAGSAVAAAANLCAVAIGTETNGSIISPASMCGVVGFKPTVGLWSRSGIIPISFTQDSAGPMTRNVSDAAILLGALTGIDRTDSESVKSEGKFLQDYSSYLKADGLQHKRIGVEKTHLRGSGKVADLFRKSLDVIKSRGAEIIEVDVYKAAELPGGAGYQVLLYEFKDGVNKYLATANARVKNLQEVIDFNKQNEATAMPYFQQEILLSAQEKNGLSEKEYTDALEKLLATRKTLSHLMEENALDAVCGISTGVAGCIDLVNGDYGTGFYFASPAARAGFPHITVPMGFVHGLPAGISFFSNAWQEGPLIEIAYAYEQATGFRKPPEFLKEIMPLTKGA